MNDRDMSETGEAKAQQNGLEAILRFVHGEPLGKAQISELVR